MSKAANQSDNFRYTVRQLQLRHPISNAPIPQFGNFREDTGECLGVTSEQYGLIQNSELLDAAHAALDAKGLSGYTEKTLVTSGGARFYTEFVFANRQIATQVGDVYGYKLTLKNSFDRSMRAAIALGFMRLTCLNGASTLEKEFAVTRKHSSNIAVDFLGKAIDNAIDNGARALRVFDTMANVTLSDEQGMNILNQFVLADALSGSLRDNISTLWLNPRRQEDKARNLYNLYNAVTEYLTHQVAASRYEYAERISNNILMRLVNAARHPDRLAKLVIPVPAEGVAIVVNPDPIANATGAVVEAEIVG